MMKTPTLLAVSALALAVAACGPKTPPVRTALDCPAERGDLKRIAMAADGTSCRYLASDGAEVTLELVAVRGGIDATLAGLEHRLAPAGTDAAAGPADVGSADAGPESAAKPAEIAAAPSAAAQKAAAEAEQDARAAGSSVTVEKDGRTIVAVRGGGPAVREDGDGTTHVNLPGVHITANDAEDTADVQIGPLRVNAGGEGATIRVRRDVRLRGEPLNPERRGVRATFIYTGPNTPDGYRYVGYEAGGPKAGPITVALVKSRSKGPGGGDIYPDVKKLVRENGGV
jgi:hypothetical protein